MPHPRAGASSTDEGEVSAPAQTHRADGAGGHSSLLACTFHLIGASSRAARGATKSKLVRLTAVHLLLHLRADDDLVEGRRCAEQQLLWMKSFYWILLDLDCGTASLCYGRSGKESTMLITRTRRFSTLGLALLFAICMVSSGFAHDHGFTHRCPRCFLHRGLWDQRRRQHRGELP